MKKISLLSFAFIFAMTPIFAVNFAFAASTYVDTNVSYSPGDNKDGTPLDVSRTDPTKALGMEDGEFVSLGYGGEIVLAFPTHIGGGALAITAFETTNSDAYPLEEANVYVSSNNIDWTFIGVADNSENVEPYRPSTFDLGDHCIKYVKLVDVTDGDAHNDDSDGYDLDAVGAEYEAECQIEEEPQPCQDCESGDSVVRNNNSAFVVNKVYAYSNTGGNYAGGSYAGEGGDGGTISGDEVDESSTGNGGDGGHSGIGGTVITGNAYSSVDAYNEVNSNRTLINRSACGDCDSGDNLVVNRNRTIVMNKIGAHSDTGNNAADGSYAGDAGDGGDIGGHKSEVDESSTGMGGNGGNSSDGGFIQSGESRSNVTFVNIVNRTLTRILR